jgi:hypothetical protein
VFDVATGRLREAQDPDQSSSELNTSFLGRLARRLGA